jgi:uncharacterized protein YacL
MDPVAAGVIEAVIAAVITFLFGKEVMNALKGVGTSIVLFPIVVIVIVCVTEMMRATTPENVAAIGNDAITRIVSYMTDRLPSVVVSEAFGGIVGAPIGFILGLIVKSDS